VGNKSRAGEQSFSNAQDAIFLLGKNTLDAPDKSTAPLMCIKAARESTSAEIFNRKVFKLAFILFNVLVRVEAAAGIISKEVSFYTQTCGKRVGKWCVENPYINTHTHRCAGRSRKERARRCINGPNKFVIWSI
jgi:hypothetical protein